MWPQINTSTDTWCKSYDSTVHSVQVMPPQVTFLQEP